MPCSYTAHLATGPTSFTLYSTLCFCCLNPHLLPLSFFPSLLSLACETHEGQNPPSEALIIIPHHCQFRRPYLLSKRTNGLKKQILCVNKLQLDPSIFRLRFSPSFKALLQQGIPLSQFSKASPSSDRVPHGPPSPKQYSGQPGLTSTRILLGP